MTLQIQITYQRSVTRVSLHKFNLVEILFTFSKFSLQLFCDVAFRIRKSILFNIIIIHSIIT